MELDLLFKLQKKLREAIGNGTDILEGEENKGEKIFQLLQALRQEISEVQDELYWKWWAKEYKEGKKYQIRDLKKIQLEVIDCLCFLLDICHAVDITTPEQLCSLYKQKWEISMERQQSNYSQNK